MTRRCRLAATIVVVAAVVISLDPQAAAHSGLRFSSPLDGATLGDAPAQVRLTFAEAPEPSLSTIRVVDASGGGYHADRPEAVTGDPLSLAVRLRSMGKGVYIVHWRAVSAVDGHASSGAFAFGVLVDPSGAAGTAAAATTTPLLEVAARTIFLGGLILLLGSAAASVAGFGSERDTRIAAVGWAIAASGLLLLIIAQLRVTGVDPWTLAATPIGRALARRVVALIAAGGAIAVAIYGGRIARPRIVRLGMGGMMLATLVAVVVHSAAGHAAADRWPVVPTVAVQAIHIVAAGIWLGGLVTLLAGLPASPSPTATASVRRFSGLALFGLIVVSASGVARSVQEVSTWNELFETSYGGVIAIKAALLAGIVMLAAYHRRRTVPMVTSDLVPLRQTGAIEVLLALITVIAAGFLGALPPAAASRATAGIEASGSDFGTTVRARFRAVSDQPGPNRFRIELNDYDTTAPVSADRVSLRFTPIDDPGVAPTSLIVAPTGAGTYGGSGANLSFAGRWRVAILLERRGNSVDVPLEIELREPPQPVSVLRVPGKAAVYTVEVPRVGLVRFTFDSERPGASHLVVTCFNVIPETMAIEHLAVTTGTTQWPVVRQDRNHFIATLELHPGENRIAVVARSEEGTRMRAVLDLKVSAN